MADQNELLKSLANFAGAIEQAIGTESTQVFIENVTAFAKDCPDVLQEIAGLVEENPEPFKQLLTRKGIEDLKGVIEVVQANAGLFGM